MDNLNLSVNDYRLLKYMEADSVCTKRLLELRRQFGFSGKVRILLFDELTSFSLSLGHSVPFWVIGAYRGNHIYLLDEACWKEREQGPLSRILLHEFVHILMHYRTGGLCPLWLNEGMALYLSGQCEVFGKLKRSFEGEIYECSYETDGFYQVCGAAVAKLFEQYGSVKIMAKLCRNIDFAADEILGKKNMRRIL
ncbi:MAG: hypothetical protein N2645_23535 [Clostridia bacterium]|nr:hypothetical protein [Clostridia bacterium]